MKVRAGTSGFSYTGWKGKFYPTGSIRCFGSLLGGRWQQARTLTCDTCTDLAPAAGAGAGAAGLTVDGAVALIESADESFDAWRELTIDPCAASSAAARARFDADAVVIVSAAGRVTDEGIGPVAHLLETSLAIGRFRGTTIHPAVAMLALLAGGALRAVAAKDRRETGDTLAIEAAESRVAIACRSALRGRIDQADLSGAVAAAGAARNAAATVARRTVSSRSVFTTAGRNGRGADLCGLRAVRFGAQGG